MFFNPNLSLTCSQSIAFEGREREREREKKKKHRFKWQLLRVQKGEKGRKSKILCFFIVLVASELRLASDLVSTKTKTFRLREPMMATGAEVVF